MMSFLKALFGASAPAENHRRLDHPRDLQAGDIIKFGYLPQKDLSNTEFEVTMVNTYIYGDMCYPELILKDRAGNIVYLMVEDEDGEEYLGISRKIPKSQADTLFDPSAIEQVQKKGTGGVLTLAEIPEEYANWLVARYKECDDNVKGAFVRGDVRFLPLQEIRQQERFTSYILIDKEDEHAVEIERYETNELEISVTVYHEIEAIEEMWPGKATVNPE